MRNAVRRSYVHVSMFSVALALAGCGDDTVNPSNPDASATKDAAASEGGNDAGTAHDASSDGASHAPPDADTSDASPASTDANDDAPKDGATGNGGDGSSDAATD